MVQAQSHCYIVMTSCSIQVTIMVIGMIIWLFILLTVTIYDDNGVGFKLTMQLPSCFLDTDTPISSYRKLS